MRTALSALDPAKGCCEAALLGALVAISGRDRDSDLQIEVETAAVARQAFRLAKHHWNLEPHLTHGGHPYSVTFGVAREALPAPIAKAGRVELRRTCCRRTWLRGAFLAAGSLTRPEHGYHLEFVLPTGLSRVVQDLLAREGLKTGRDDRRVYIKAADDILAFLSLIGANAARLAYEQVLMGRELKNRVQRTVNCETANLSRTVEAAQRQVVALERLLASQAASNLPFEMVLTAELRVAHPYATLADLAFMHDPPLSKSAVNHRLRALMRRADAGAP